MSAVPTAMSLRDRSALFNSLEDIERWMQERYRLSFEQRDQMRRNHEAFANGRSEPLQESP